MDSCSSALALTHNRMEPQWTSAQARTDELELPSVCYALVKRVKPNSEEQALESTVLTHVPDVWRQAPSAVLFSPDTLSNFLSPVHEIQDKILAEVAQSPAGAVIATKLRPLAARARSALIRVDERANSEAYGYNRRLMTDLLRGSMELVLLDRILAPIAEDSWSFPVECGDVTFQQIERAPAAFQQAGERFAAFREAFESVAENPTSELARGEAVPNCSGSVYEAFAQKNTHLGIVHGAAANFATVALAVRIILERGIDRTEDEALHRLVRLSLPCRDLIHVIVRLSLQQLGSATRPKEIMLHLHYALSSSLVLLLGPSPVAKGLRNFTDIEVSSLPETLRLITEGWHVQKVNRILFTPQTLCLEKDLYSLVWDMVVNGPGVWFQRMTELLRRHSLHVSSAFSSSKCPPLTVWSVTGLYLLLST